LCICLFYNDDDDDDDDEEEPLTPALPAPGTFDQKKPLQSASSKM
jgi:hypothetical protein